MFENINFGKGVTRKYFDFDVNNNIPLGEQIDLLKEDLIQIIYYNDYLIDLGWYPEFDKDGFFRVSVIKDYQWDKPILQKRCKDIDVLEEYIHECINIVQSTII